MKCFALESLVFFALGRSAEALADLLSVRGGAALSAFGSVALDGGAGVAVGTSSAVLVGVPAMVLPTTAVASEEFPVATMIHSARGGAAPSVIVTATLEAFASGSMAHRVLADCFGGAAKSVCSDDSWSSILSRQIFSPAVFPYLARNCSSE